MRWRGEERSVAVWARVLGVPAQVIYNRLRSGWSAARALATPWRYRDRMVVYRRRRDTISGHARAAGLEVALVFGRLHYGWSLERALEKPPRQRKQETRQ